MITCTKITLVQFNIITHQYDQSFYKIPSYYQQSKDLPEYLISQSFGIDKKKSMNEMLFDHACISAEFY
jgi:hypothetical protein